MISFSDIILVSKLSWLRKRDNKINNILHDRYIIYKTVKPSHLKKLEII